MAGVVTTFRLSNGVPLVPLREHEEYRKVVCRGGSLDETFSPDAPKSGKGGRFIRQSFRKGLPKMKSPANKTSTLIKTIGTTGQTNESVSRAVEDVRRSLQFYQDTVVKEIFDMLPGSATVVLDMVLSLSLALDEAYSGHSNRHRMSQMQRGLHFSLAELVRWSDNFLLLHSSGSSGENSSTPSKEPPPPEAHRDTVFQVVGDVRNAVQQLVDMASKEDVLRAADPPSTPKLSLQHNKDNNNRHPSDGESNRNSLPEIILPPSPSYSNSPPPSPTITNTSSLPRPTRRKLKTRKESNLTLPTPRLSHSLSSDSILHPSNGGHVEEAVEELPPQITTVPPTAELSEYSTPPPLPPKRKSHNRSSSSSTPSPHYSINNGSPILRTPVQYSSRVFTHSADCLSSPGGGSGGSRNGLDAIDTTRLSVNSSGQLSPASSLDSFNAANDTLRHSLTSPLQVDLASSLSTNFRLRGSSEGLLQEEEHNHLTSYFPDCASINIHESSNRQQIYSEEFHSSQQCNSTSKVSFIRMHQHTSTSTHLRSSTSSSSSTLSSEGETGPSHHSLTVPPPVPAKQRLIDSTVTLREKNEPSPELPPKKNCVSNASISSGYISSSNSSMLSNSSNSSAGSAHCYSASIALRRHTTAESSLLSHLSDSVDRPPELPPKKNKPILDYMELFQDKDDQSRSDFVRRSYQPSSITFGSEYDNLSQRHHIQHLSLQEERQYLHFKQEDHASLQLSYTTNGVRRTCQPAFITENICPSSCAPPALPPKQRRSTSQDIPEENDLSSSPPPPLLSAPPQRVEEVAVPPPSPPRTPLVEEETKDSEKTDICAVGEESVGILELLDAHSHIIRKKEGEEGPEIRGGPPDSLIVHACSTLKPGQFSNEDRVFQDAFLTTYRTFISPDELVEKLLCRYHKFISRGSTHREEQAAASNAFSFLVCVVEDLSISDLTLDLLKTLSEFQHELLCKADFKMAKMLRTSLVKKLETRKRYHERRKSLASIPLSTKQMSLIDFKSSEIAEQMTLLDAELFHKVEIPEVLIWASEQNEERSPNLNNFTDHFNKMSYWVRTRILDQIDGKERERYVVKFIKILKHLRKLNNFNSYLALLSALDSAPIRRLEWQKTITDGLKEYCALIDSSSSFRAYRNALAESSPPCIPYIGLILQDLTFVNIGNNDNLPDGEVNFSKRWQQFNILDNMKRFRKSNYNFKKKEKIIEFFNDFEDYENEDVLWEKSKEIKPSGAKNLK